MTKVAAENFDKERHEWQVASEEAFVRTWDNEYDAIYDNWVELYGFGTDNDMDENAIYKLALRAMTRKGLPEW